MKRLVERVLYPLRKRPVISFLVLVIGLVSVITLSRTAEDESPEQSVQISPREVSVMRLSQDVTFSAQAVVSENGIVTINAQTQGIVSNISVKEGQIVPPGKELLRISTTYGGGNPASISRQIATEQYNNAKKTYESQKEIIRVQRDIAERSDDNADRLREITEESLSSTRSLIDLNRDIVDSLEEQLTELEENTNDDQAITALQQQLLGQRSSLSQLESSLRNAEYESDVNNPPSSLSNLNREATIRQLELQESTLGTNLEIARLQLAASRIQESIFFPVSPLSAQIEQILVSENDTVSPGTPLVILQATDLTDTKLDIYLASAFREIISKDTPVTVFRDGKEIDGTITHVSSIPVLGDLYAASIVTETQLLVQNGARVEVSLRPSLEKSEMVVPLSSIHQTEEEAIIYIANGSVAEARSVTLGEIIGEYVEITEGLDGEELIIISRNVVDGQRIAYE